LDEEAAMRWKQIGKMGVVAALLGSTGCCWWCDRWCARPVSAGVCAPVCCSASPGVVAPAGGPTYIAPQALAPPGQQTSWQNPAGGPPQTLVRGANGCYCPQ
jgi:hypothetical protein